MLQIAGKELRLNYLLEFDLNTVLGIFACLLIVAKALALATLE